MKKLSFVAILALSTISIILSVWSLVRSYKIETRETQCIEPEIEYTLYIGTNDKDTFKLEMTLDEARDIVYNTMLDYFSDGFTMSDANGVWKDENDTITLEYTFICIIEHADKSEVYKVADELIEKLNQNTILIVSNYVESVDFYSGNK